ncbi:aldehyde dehydrogenase (NADP(+)) [Saccharospirillum salsuginis]|uniref:2,5-dioxovalerate dehydrogenase n=1 Tax=Saccharospirillum salsuginis TaxID=418750 RepID=A0A918KMF9_9GAMM|nr:aldehyde dehydrogenase (NADP(+)) [Saccharospirillum salsuginis]GGX68751.1 2,5-dioxovalerate dehydrogenase [Saccharospirillum salsuginis]
MELTGHSLIGQSSVPGAGTRFTAIDAATGEPMSPSFGSLSPDQVDQACHLAAKAFDAYRETPPNERARFLDTIADEIEALGDGLIRRAMAESGLPRPRLEGERGRTCNQLRLFATVVQRGEWMDVRVDTAQPERTPMPRSDLRQRHIGIGPVAVFGASNFPLAFSVAGGDTASALAAGCPVVVKAHPAHPGTSELVGRAIQRAIARCDLAEGVFSLIFDAGHDAGATLVAHPDIQAVGFTGSRTGGLALTRIAQSRPQPIPVYAEMSSINPVFLFPEALQHRADDLAEGFVASMTLGAGQFCTNPGLVLAVRGDDLNRFVETAARRVRETKAQTMLTPGIAEAYRTGCLKRADAANQVAQGEPGPSNLAGRSTLFKARAAEFRKNPTLREEVFGAASVIVECDDLDEMQALAEQLEGQLTATLQLDDGDWTAVQRLVPTLERRAGRLLVNGWPTGVEVCDAMVHGGPFPATTDTRSTSVGSAAIQRFLRPVCYQDFPETLLPASLRDDNPFGVSRLVNGEREYR